MKFQTWQLYVLLAGLSWGTYVPIIFYGGSVLSHDQERPAPASRIMAILCVGLAYFVLAVLIPTVLFLTGQQKWSDVKLTPHGLAFSSLAGVMGALGAICVVFASKSAMDAGRVAKALDPAFNVATYRMYIAPLIFGLAPVINTLVSLVWHPKGENWFRFGFEVPDWKLLVGIVLVGAGAALVLFSKEQKESGGKPTAAATQPAEGASS